MIIKSFEINKINLNINNLILFHGNNEGLKKENSKILLKDKKNIYYDDERNIIENSESFLEGLNNKSFFEKEKIFIIRRSTDKILKIINHLNKKNLEDIIIIFDADILDKKSKLRSYFEKDKKYVSIAFYPDDLQTLSKFAFNYLKKKNIIISQANINSIISKCSGDRIILINELQKIENYARYGKKVTEYDIARLTNLIENHSISDLIDSCLIGNKKKTIKILNENNFTNEDCIIITRTFLSKSKRIHKLCINFKENKNIELTLSNAKPPIFWKDKDTIKQQILGWKPENIRKLIYKTATIELLIKKNINNSLKLITDFILDQCSRVNN